MTMKAFAVTCKKYFPDKVVYYAAETPDGAITAARLSLMKIGRNAKRADIVSMRAPEYDEIAKKFSRTGCIDSLIAEISPA